MNTPRNAVEIVFIPDKAKPKTISDHFDEIKSPVDKGDIIQDHNGISYRVSVIVSSRTGGRTFIQVRDILS